MLVDGRRRDLGTDGDVDHKTFVRPEGHFPIHSLAGSVGKGRHKDLPLQRLREAGRKRFGPEVQRHKRALILMLPDKKQ